MTSEIISQEIIENHEIRLESNISIHHHTVANPCPITGGQFYKVVLETIDLNRIFLCHSLGFVNFTQNDSFRLSETLENHPPKKQITDFKVMGIDLRQSFDRAPIFLSNDLSTGNLVALDGNHRLISHYLIHRNIEGLQAYLFVHNNATNCQWYI